MDIEEGFESGENGGQMLKYHSCLRLPFHILPWHHFPLEIFVCLSSIPSLQLEFKFL